MTTTGILLFDGAEELDFVGPWEVMTMAAMLSSSHRVVTISAGAPDDAVVAAKGMRVLADHVCADAPDLDVLLIPGGQGTRDLARRSDVIDWVGARAAACSWVGSVCTGALVLAAAKLLEGKRATTHWAALDELRAYDGIEVMDEVRYVRDGRIVTAAGVSAGIDMTLWLLGQIETPSFARKVQRLMEYEPAPPYRAAGSFDVFAPS